MDNKLLRLPRVIVLGTGEKLADTLEKNRQYRLYIGRSGGEISLLVLSTKMDWFTEAMLLLKDVVKMRSVEFEPTQVIVDVYHHEILPDESLIAKFWGKESGYAWEDCPAIEPFLRTGMEDEWKKVLGVDTTFYPFGGPSDPNVAHKYPDFMRILD